MENNKPEWLLKAEEEQAKFLETKWAKYTDSQLASVNGGATARPRYDSEYQSEMGKRGGAKGAAVAESSQRDKYGDEYNKVMKSRLYDNLKNKEEFHKAGAAASAASRTAKKNALIEEIIKDLPSGEITLDSVAEIMVKHGRGRTYFGNILHYMPERFELVKAGVKGYSRAIYKKVLKQS